MNVEVSGGQEKSVTQFKHMVLVSGLPLRTVWSGKKDTTFHSLKAVRTLLPNSKRSLSDMDCAN